MCCLYQWLLLWHCVHTPCPNAPGACRLHSCTNNLSASHDWAYQLQCLASSKLNPAGVTHVAELYKRREERAWAEGGPDAKKSCAGIVEKYRLERNSCECTRLELEKKNRRREELRSTMCLNPALNSQSSRGNTWMWGLSERSCGKTQLGAALRFWTLAHRHTHARARTHTHTEEQTGSAGHCYLKHLVSVEWEKPAWGDTTFERQIRGNGAFMTVHA